MKLDRYAKVVLTLIAVALLYLCFGEPGPKWGTPAQAAGIGEAGVMARNAALAVAEGPPSDVVVQSSGRFFIQELTGFCSANLARNHVLLDTETGRTWLWVGRPGDKKGEKILDEIDEVVYDLYELTPKQVARIENSTLDWIRLSHSR